MNPFITFVMFRLRGRFGCFCQCVGQENVNNKRASGWNKDNYKITYDHYDNMVGLYDNH